MAWNFQDAFLPPNIAGMVAANPYLKIIAHTTKNGAMVELLELIDLVVGHDLRYLMVHQSEGL